MNITLQSNIQMLKLARDKVAAVYANEATDEHYDNGNLTTMNNAILSIQNAIQTLKARLPSQT